MARRLLISLLPLLLAACATEAATGPSERGRKALVTPEEFVSLALDAPDDRKRVMKKVARTWHPGYAVMALELMSLSREPQMVEFLVSTLEEKTGQRFGRDIQRWFEWVWSRPYDPHPRYAEFKSLLYRLIDPRFAGYFSNDRRSDIRLDEVRWGGVHQDGIPPLRSPKMIPPAEATWLADDHVVFGIEVEGDARAYPKRILAWHEMFTDAVGGVPVAGVYCTLCGTVILYETRLGGVSHELGTSGFLYRSNKLMYDRATQTLWNTLWGRPAIGPLVGEPIQLVRRSVVTTTWGEWRRRHPDTQVLSLDTGHRRDYSEGAAYREYFATDELMFNVPKLDRRLKNKDEILALTLDRPDVPPLAISAAFLEENRVHHETLGSLELVILTDASGANRVYRSGGVRFASWDLDESAVDESGVTWKLSETQLAAPDGRTLARQPAQRAFWFGWYAAYPDTRLVK